MNFRKLSMTSKIETATLPKEVARENIAFSNGWPSEKAGDGRYILKSLKPALKAY
jgi:hypothetical protein